MFPSQNNMAALVAIFIFCFSFKLNYADSTEKLIWPTEFHLNVEQLNLKIGIVETMELWSSTKQNRSRVDFYGGMTKQYYIWPQDGIPLGYVLNVYPYSNENQQNVKQCRDAMMDGENYKFLPDVAKYKYAGETVHEGLKVRVWELRVNLVKQMWKEFTIYTTQPEPGYEVPVQMVQKVFYNERGMLAGHVVTNYFNFYATLDPKVFDADGGFSAYFLDTPYTSTPWFADGCMLLSKGGEDFHRDVKYLHPSIESHVNTAFHSFKNHHKKHYTSQGENELRKHIFAKNWAFINNHNRQNHSYKLQVNRFADFTPEERASLRGTKPSKGPGSHVFPHSDEEVKVLAEELPKNFDLRLEGVISPIKNQASCGSCWAFSSTAAVEGALAWKNGGRILDLSEQSLVDCSWGFDNNGCGGGSLQAAFRYIHKHKIPLEEAYGAYLQKNGYCHRDNITETYGIEGFAKVTPLNPAALRVVLNKYGPAAVNINFSDAMEFYSSGVFYDPTCNNGKVNHGVTVVGYGHRNGSDYWIVRNSYGDDWGENGYMLLSAADNNCFILDSPYYPIV